MGAGTIKRDAFDEFAIGAENADTAIAIGGDVYFSGFVDCDTAVSWADGIAVRKFSPLGMGVECMGAVAGGDGMIERCSCWVVAVVGEGDWRKGQCGNQSCRAGTGEKRY